MYFRSMGAIFISFETLSRLSDFVHQFQIQIRMSSNGVTDHITTAPQQSTFWSFCELLQHV